MSDRPSKSAELLLLCGKARDDVLTPEDAARLDTLLQSSDPAKALYVRYMSVVSLLESRGASADAADAKASDTFDHDLFSELLQMEEEAEAQLVHDVGHLRGRSKTPLQIGGAMRWAFQNPTVWTAAAMLAITTILAVVFIGTGDDPTPTKPNPSTAQQNEPPATQADQATAVATLTNTQNAQWAGPASAAPARGSKLHPNDRLTLTAGFAEITTNRGTIAILEAPATIELSHNKNALYLETGKLVGICETESSKGFLVSTPHMDITDLGTRFGVQANAADTEIHVFDGEVVASQPNRLDNEPVYLTRGQSASATRGRPAVVQITQSFEKVQRFSAIAVDQRTLPGTGAELRVGQIDPNWRVIEMDGRVLDSPRPVEVITAPEYTGPLFEASKLKASQMVGFVPEHGSDAKQPYVFQTSFDISESMEIASTLLELRYMADIHLEWVRINGQRVQLDRAVTGWERFEQTTIAQHLQHGKNTIAFEVSNLNPRSDLKADPGAIGLRLEWSLRSVATANPATDAGGP